MLALSVLAPLALFAWTARTDYVAAMEDAERTATRTAIALHEHAAKVLETHEIILRDIDRRLGDRSWNAIEADARLHDDLVRVARELGQVDAISLADAQGRVRLTSHEPELRNLSIADREHFQAQRERDAGTFIGVPHVSRITGERVISVSRRRTTADGGFDGVIVITTPISYLTSFWEQFAPTIAHVIPLVRADGLVIARYPALDNPERLDTDGPFLSRAVAEPQGVYRAVSLVDGVERLNAYTRIKDYPLYVSFSIETGAILRHWYEHMAVHGASTLLAAFALAGITGVAMRQYRAMRLSAQRWHEAADQLQAEIRAREKAEAALLQSQKMEAVGQLTGGIAHDFNNLLQSLSGGFYFLSKQVPDDARHVIDASMQAVERGAKLVRQLMAFARRQRLEPQPVDLGSLVVGMGELLQKAVGTAVRIDVEIERNLDAVMVDPTQAELAILNLAINARDAMDGGGRITIAAHRQDPTRSGGGKLAPGEYVVLSVTDNGHGMAPEVRDRAFDPFFTTKEVGKGTGLGLSMVHGFATQSGGDVEIESAPGRGTTVRLYLPKSDAAPLAKPADSPPVPRASAHETILLVDDESLARMATAQALRDLGYRVLETRNGRDALSILDGGAAVDLLVTDFAMPEMTGIQLATAVRDLRPGLPVIVVTGYATFDDKAAAVTAVVRKPFRIEQLAQCIHETLHLGKRSADAAARSRTSQG